MKKEIDQTDSTDQSDQKNLGRLKTLHPVAVSGLSANSSKLNLGANCTLIL